METNESQKSLVDWLLFDLTNFFLQDYEEVNSEEIQGVYCIDYEKNLPEIEFSIFDRIRLRVFSKVKEIECCDHVNVTYFVRNNEWNEKKLDNLVDLLIDIYGPDQNNKGKLTSEDFTDLKLNIFNRVWTLGSAEHVYSVQLTKKEKEGLELNIIFLKNLLHYEGKL